MTKIYDQHDAAFKRVSAFVILKDGKRFGSVAFKFPADGAGRLYAYVQLFGAPMVRGFASGGGYDKRTAAVSAAAEHLDFGALVPDFDKPTLAVARFAMMRDDGQDWADALRKAGFDVWQAV